MRFVLFLFTFAVLFACSKNERLEKKMEGQWTLVKRINVDGSEIELNDIYIFQGGSSTDGLPLTIYNSDTLSYKYTIDKKAKEIKFTDATTGNLIENWGLDFIDKDDMVLKTGYAFLLFER